MDKPKFYNISTGTKGYDPDRGAYIEYPTEDEYFEMVREDKTNET